MKATSRALFLIGFTVLAGILSAASPKRRVASISLNSPRETIELWEQRYGDLTSLLTRTSNYRTWLVLRAGDGHDTWHLVDDKYFVYRYVSVLANSRGELIRLESGGDTYPVNSFAEYNRLTGQIRIESQPSVRGSAEWSLIEEVKIR